jgi:apolipoprotein N-acyltransferase
VIQSLGAVTEFGEKLAAQEGWRLRGLSFLLGAVLALSFAPFGLFFLPFAVLPIMILILDQQEDRHGGFLVGWWFGFGHFLAGLFWIGHSFLAQSQMPAWAAPLAVIAICYALAYFFAFAFTAYKVWAPDGWRRVLVFAVVWVAFEWLRGHIFTGLPWNLLANIWFVSDQMMQGAAYLGTYGLSFITVLCAAGLVLFVSKPSGADIGGVPVKYLPLVFLALLFMVGGVRLHGTALEYHDNVRMRIVQAAIPQTEKWVRANWRANYMRHVDLSLGADGGQGITHVIWPETAIPYSTIDVEPARRFVLAGMLGNRLTLISGAPRREDNGTELKVFNSIHVIGASGEMLATYDKFHLVPFGEYVPLRSLLSRIGLQTIVPGTLDYSSGPGLRTIRLPGLPAFSPLVCYEVIFAGQAVRRDDRPEWILNLTNDAWFGTTPGPHQHFALARFRAVEEGLPIIRAAGTGISAFIDPYGRVISSIELGRAGSLDSNLPKPLSRLTLYARFGDWIFLILILMTAVVASRTGRDGS